MNPQTWWYVARATGLVAWALASASVISGLVFTTRLTHGRPTRAWQLDLHRFFGAAAVVFTLLHLVGLAADTYVQFDLADLLVPFASSWKPLPVALGIAALYLLLAIELTSVLMRRLPRRVWRAVHLTSYTMFWLASFHLLLAGTDAANVVARWAAVLVMVTVVFLTLVRILSPRAARPGPSPGRAHAVGSSGKPRR